MAVSLRNKTIISQAELIELGNERLAEAEALRLGAKFAGAVYLAGYAVECYLKAAICKTLDLSGLPIVFMTHDLDVLLFHSGLDNTLRADTVLAGSFTHIVGIWSVERREERQGGKTIMKESVRYRKPSDFDDATAKSFLTAVAGVVKWLRTKT